METKDNAEFLTNQGWFEAVLDEPVILRGNSAIEVLGGFLGWIGERKIYVYGLQKGKYDNIDYRVVDSFATIPTVKVGNLTATTFEQTVNELLGDWETVDNQPLIEALCRYYFLNGESWDGLNIWDSNESIFKTAGKWAIESAVMQ